MSSLIGIAPARFGRGSGIARRNRVFRRRRHAVILEPVHTLERRRLLSQTFTVTSTSTAQTPGTLNWAILQIDSQPYVAGSAPYVIDFDIPGTGPFTIPAPDSGIYNPVIVDGYSQPGSSPNTLAQGDNAVIEIVLSGGGSLGYGLSLGGTDSTVEGLAINDCQTDLQLDSLYFPPGSPGPVTGPYGGDTVTGCFLGTDATGEQAVPDGTYGNGIEVDVSSNTIGGTTPADRNIISTGATAFVQYGIWVTGSSSGDNLIEGNYIGTDATGTQSLGNWQGISFYQCGNGNTVGGTTPGSGNIISGSIDAGLIISGSGSGLLVEGNMIGTDVTGTVALPNGTESAGHPGYSLAPGVEIGTSGNTVGGATPGAGNLISGNINDGIDIISQTSSPSGNAPPGGSDNLVEGNIIGLNLNGTESLPNENEGIGLSEGAGYNTIGGTQAGAGNVISGNGSSSGIESCALYLSANGNNLVQGNLIGTDITGTQSIPNIAGIIVQSPSNTIGGTEAGAGNVISSNTNSDGIDLSGGDNNLIQGNLVGTNAAGNTALPNYQGIVVQTSGNTIGGAQSGAGNVISGNTWGGLILDNGDNLIQGNLIGTNVTGDASVPNGFLSYYSVGGIDVFSNSNTIGGTAAGAGNVISGNGSDGVDMVGVSDNLLEGNLIGVGANGTEPLGNGGGGVSAFYGATYNTIGGTAAGAGNVIANNQTRPGVNIGVSNSDNCPGNEILSNSIYNNGMLGINLGFNTTPNQNMSGGPFQGPNDLQNYPVITEVLTYPSYSAVAITGTLNSAPNTTYTLQFFANTTADPSGYGEGQTLIGTTTVTTDASGNASFAATFNGLVIPVGDAVSATATDPSGNTSEFALDVDAFAGDAPLQAVEDSYNTDVNTTLTVAAPGVQANDFSVLGPFTSQLVSSTSHGTLTFDSNGSFTYVPDKGYTGTDSFTYDDTADGVISNVATVTISVNPRTLYVTNTNDSGPGSLRQAMITANASNAPGADTIDFNIPGTGPFMISPASPLPIVSLPTIINGYSQPGAQSNSQSTGDNAVIEIQIDGSSSGGADGLVLAGGGSTMEGFSITDFSDGILITGAGGDTVTGDFLGTTPAGNAGGYGNQVGMEIQTSGNTIGGSKPALRDVISCNNNQGVLLDDGASGNLIAGDYIGTDLTGENRLGNNGGGVVLHDAPANTIGGGAPGDGNVISANGNDGVQVSSSDNGPGSLDTVIQGNIIGLDAKGMVALGNSSNGVEIDYGAGTLIGGPKASDANVISANQAGVYLQNSAVDIAIEGNKIGTDASGEEALGNQYDGVLLSGSDNTVGGTTAAAGNLISGNGRDGISDGVYAGTAGNNDIEGNKIGTDVTGTVAIPNGQDGIELAANGDLVGGTTAATRNVISGNSQNGLVLEGNATGIRVEGNDIGTDKTGTQPLGNGSDGVLIESNASANTIGGTTARYGNTIAFNGGTGVTVTDSAVSDAILTNSIYANGDQGILLSGNGNDLQAAPVLSSAVSSRAVTVVSGTLTAAPNTTYQIQFFADPSADPSGSGQGETFLVTEWVTTNASGVAAFSVTIRPKVASGDVISATATSPAENTSAFSNDVTVTTSSVAMVGGVLAAAPTDLVLGALTSTSSDAMDTVLTELAVDLVQARKRPGGTGS
jgi:hypothetical protein